MWTVVFVSQNKDVVLKIKTALENINVLTKIKPLDNECKQKECFQVLVPYAEVGEALDIIIEMDV